MASMPYSARYSRLNPRYSVEFIAFIVALNGLFILASTLFEQIHIRHFSHITSIQIDVPILVGISVLYLSTLLRRRKHNAWLITIAAYCFYLLVGIVQLLNISSMQHLHLHIILRSIVFPALIIALLLGFAREFVVKSDVRGFRVAARTSVIILLIALLYGVIGFQLLDNKDFHQEINLPLAAHYTIDQFNVTTNKPLQPYTKRAHIFVDSLSLISTVAIIYAAISLFQPIRQRLVDQAPDRDRALALLRKYSPPSEEFFKIWPHDKQYFFDKSGQSFLAYHSFQGVALCVSDPVGEKTTFITLIQDFKNMCFYNDWSPAFIHVSDDNKDVYKQNGFALQKLGEEAIVTIETFNKEVAGTKYFRQINNKFTKQGYTHEFLSPPHHGAVIDRLSAISNDWLGQGGRAERGFAMGYFSEEYMQMCDLIVARDAAGTIQGFINIIPANFDKEEATYDLLRNSNGSLGNINDYMLMNLMNYLQDKGYTRLNLGLAPLGGLKETDSEERTLINNLLQFAYANGDRFYSFSGLHRFKAKYQPEWQDRYIVYQDGMRGFSKTITALTRCMRKVVRLP